KMLKKVQCWVLLLASLSEINAFKYLVVSPIPTKSHAILGDALVEHIANAGHEVTYITSYVPENVSPRVTVVYTGENIKCFPSDDNFNVKTSLDGTLNSNSFSTYAPMMMNISRATITDPKVQTLMADRSQQFDAVIAEWMYNEVYAG
ncbi:jg21824, partial [Pararge aegeria aegeria]